MKECTHKPEVTPSRIFKPAPNCRRCERHRNDSVGDRLKKREQDLVVQRPTRNVRRTAFTRRLFHQRAWRLTLVFSPQIHQAPAYVKRIARSMTHIRPVFAYPVRKRGGENNNARRAPHLSTVAGPMFKFVWCGCRDKKPSTKTTYSFMSTKSVRTQRIGNII